MCLISLNFCGFSLWSLAVLFQLVRSFYGILSKLYGFWPLTSSFSVERDFNKEPYAKSVAYLANMLHHMKVVVFLQKSAHFCNFALLSFKVLEKTMLSEGKEEAR